MTPADLPDGEGWAIERMRITTHNGTHLDAPWHYASTMDNGHRAITIDEVPLEWCLAPGIKLDFRHLSTAETNCARWRRKSVPAWVNRKGMVALPAGGVGGRR